MKMSLDTHDARTCYADIEGHETYSAERGEEYARRHNRQIIEVYKDGDFDRAFTVELQPTVRP